MSMEISPNKAFEPPVLESAFSLKPIIFLALNILTLGVYGSVEAVHKQFRIKELKIDREQLADKIHKLSEDWQALEKEFEGCHEAFRQAQESGEQTKLAKLDKQLDNLLSRVETLQERDVSVEGDHPLCFSHVILGTIAFIEQFFANLLTVGVYGAYQNHVKKNRMTLLEARNAYLQESAASHSEGKAREIASRISLLSDLIAIQSTDQAKALNESKAAKQYAKNALQEKEKTVGDLKTVQQNLTALQTQKATVELAKGQVETQLAAARLQLQQKQTVEADRDRLRQEGNKKDAELVQLRQKLNQAANSLSQINNLESQIRQLKAVNQAQPEAVKMHHELGAIPPQYTPQKEDGEINGAVDINDDGEIEGLVEGAEISAEWMEFAAAYNDRYKDKRTAAEIIVAAFENAYESLNKMRDEGDKIKLNRSPGTLGTPGEMAIYAEMVYDILLGARCHHPTCHGYELQINEYQNMVPSQPEKVLQFRDEGEGNRRPVTVVRYKRHDDFFPDEDRLGTRNGLDPVGAKWIIQQLTKEEREHLLNLLRSPLIENSHIEMQKTTDYMRDRTDPRVKLIETAYGLISDMGRAIQMKFGKTALVPCWQRLADDDDSEPFIKAEDQELQKANLLPDLVPAVKEPPAPKAIDRTNFVETEESVKAPDEIVEWTLNHEVISAKNTQPEFYQMVANAQKKYAAVFKHLSKDILAHPKAPGKPIASLTGKVLIEQYHISHEVLNQGCLYSNLLALFVADKTQITEENIRKLKRAMAAYLDELKDVQLTVDAIQSGDVDFGDMAGLPQLMERVELKRTFEDSIKSNHKCTVEQYQAWLRGEHGAPSIYYGNLSPFEMQLAAYALNVKIGVFNIDLNAAAQVDGYGRILPDGYYGPNTSEVLLMGGTNGSYYGLFPRVDLNKCAKRGIPQDELNQIKEVQAYWTKLGMARWW